MPILQINFRLNVSPAEYRELCKSLAPVFANVPGLTWKIWLLNEQEKEAGGIYLFNSSQALENFVNGPLAAQVRSHPGLRDFTAKQFDSMDEVTAMTHGPIAAAAMAAV
jgi:hypothetical protein